MIDKTITESIIEELPGNARTVTVNENKNILAIGVMSGNMLLYDISDSSNPILLKEIDYGSTYVRTITIENNILVVGGMGDHYADFKLYDISDPSNPVLLKTVSDFVNDITDTYIEGNILSVGSDDRWFRLYDISDPNNPIVLSSNNDEERIYALHIEEDIFALSMLNGKEKLYDISDPANPVLLSTISDHSGQVWGCFISGNILVSTSSQPLVTIHDISDPENPVLLSTISDHTSTVWKSFIKDNILVTGSEDQTAKLYDISDPANPILLNSYHIGAPVRSIYIYDNILVTGSEDETAKLYDISGYQNDFIDIPFAKLPSFTFRGNEYKTDNDLSEISVYLNDTHLESYTDDLFSRKEISIDPANLEEGDNFFLVIAEDADGNQSRATAVIGKEYFSKTTLEHDTEEYKLIMPQGSMHAEASWGEHPVGYVTDSVRFLFDRKPNNMLPVTEASEATDTTVTVKRVQNVETEVIG